MKKVFFFVLVFLLLIIVAVSAYLIQSKRLILTDKRQRLALYCLPDDIQHEKYMSNRYGLRKGETKPLQFCPGYDDYDPGFANLQIDKVFLRIPRKILGNYIEADGPADDVHFVLSYPSFGPWKNGDRDFDLIEFEIGRTKRSQLCEGDECISMKDYDYFMNFITNRSESVIGYKNQIQKHLLQNEVEILGDGVKKIKTKSGHTYFIGGRYSPDYWINCEKVTCFSYFWISDFVYVRYQFHKKQHFSKHLEIVEEIKSKISGFRVN